MRNFLRECRPKQNAQLDDPQPISKTFQNFKLFNIFKI